MDDAGGDLLATAGLGDGWEAALAPAAPALRELEAFLRAEPAFLPPRRRSCGRSRCHSPMCAC
ncbi:hypothetical protein GCM10025873_17470 [Demequina sediminis]|uniref:hypothetical protein n=1 Tax=Demequina sediminis TaxID=1930058 RepID=UPI003D9BAB8D|nr:hypothetical protein GCM10025873_17470 [Demequina sediminis]